MTPTRIKVEKTALNGFCAKPEKINILKNTTSTEFACIPDPSRVYKNPTKSVAKQPKKVTKRKQFFGSDKYKGQNYMESIAQTRPNPKQGIKIVQNAEESPRRHLDSAQTRSLITS